MDFFSVAGFAAVAFAAGYYLGKTGKAETLGKAAWAKVLSLF